jgi:hypothetical protein
VRTLPPKSPAFVSSNAGLGLGRGDSQELRLRSGSRGSQYALIACLNELCREAPITPSEWKAM